MCTDRGGADLVVLLRWSMSGVMYGLYVYAPARGRAGEASARGDGRAGAGRATARTTVNARRLDETAQQHQGTRRFRNK